MGTGPISSKTSSLRARLLRFGRQESARTPGDPITEISGDIAALIDAAAECRAGSRNVDGSKDAGSQQKRVRAGSIRELPRDAAPVVDSENPCERNTGKVNRLKLSVPQEETMGRSLSANRPVIILPDNISSLVDSARSSLQVSRNIDLAESALRQQEPMGYTVRAGESTNHLARAVDSLWSGCDGSGDIDRGNGLCVERGGECRHRQKSHRYSSAQH